MVKYSQAFGLRRGGFRAMRWYLFLTPIILAILLFMAYPAGESLRLSFMKSNGIRESFRGWKNYEIVLTNGLFWKSVWNTFYITFFNVIFVITAYALH